MKRNVSIALVALTVGCGAGIAAHNSIVPPAGAQVQGRAFQHMCTELQWDQILGQNQLAPQLGAQGWELATFVSAEQKGGWGSTTRIIACFKREVAR